MPGRSEYCERVGCRIPLQQSPMGSVSSPDLAVAIAEAGGVGTVSALGMSPASLERLLDGAAARTTGVLAANFLTAAVDPEAVEVAAARVPVIDFFWNTPDAALVERAHRHGAVVSWQVGSPDEARAAVDAGADVLVVQGVEAGGHVRATAPLLTLLGTVLDAVDVPVLAAGGIGHPRALAAVLAAGAAGARVGTAFIATHESGAHPTYKAAVVAAGPGDSAITDSFALGCPLCATSARHRVLRSCIDERHGGDGPVVGTTTIGRATVTIPRGSPLSPASTTTGEIGAMALYASDAAASVHELLPAGEVLHRLWDGALAQLTAATR